MPAKQTKTTQSNRIHILQPDWPLTDMVTAGTTLRSGGVSQLHYASLNLGLHVGDKAKDVAINRQRLQQHLGWSQPPRYLHQDHTTHIACLDQANDFKQPYDAAMSKQKNTPCLVMTADCLPILLAHADGDVVAAVHAGWRGLAEGILAASLRAMQVNIGKMYAWMGPAISAPHYSVDQARYQQLIMANPTYQTAFNWCPVKHRYATDLYQLARLQLGAMGVDSSRVYGGKWCTYRQSEQFFSYRRDGSNSGRMATFISLN